MNNEIALALIKKGKVVKTLGKKNGCRLELIDWECAYGSLIGQKSQNWLKKCV